MSTDFREFQTRDRARMLRRPRSRAAWAGFVVILQAVTTGYPWNASREGMISILLLAACQLLLLFLVAFPLMIRGAERWGKPLAWLWLLAGLSSVFVGSSLIRWAIRAWMG